MSELRLENVYLDDEGSTNPSTYDLSATVSLAPSTTTGPSKSPGSAPYDPGNALQFHDFGTSSTYDSAAPPAPTEEREGLVQAGDVERGLGTAAYAWQLACYAPYFNVTTAEVLARLRLVLWPLAKGTYWETFHYYPDMYGPVWVSLTLILTIAMSGNLTAYLGHDPESAALPATWSYDLEKLTVATSLIVGLGLLFPLAMWGALAYFGSRARYVRLLSLTGYGLAPFVPASVLCAIPSDFIQWVSLLCGVGLSFWFLFRNMHAEVKQALPYNYQLAVLGVVGVVYLGVLITLKLYFFQ